MFSLLFLLDYRRIRNRTKYLWIRIQEAQNIRILRIRIRDTVYSARSTVPYWLEVGQMCYALRYVRNQWTIIINVRISYNTSAPLILPAQWHDQLINLRVGEPGGSGVPLAIAPNLSQRVLYQATAAARQRIFTARSPASGRARSVLRRVWPRTASRAFLSQHHACLWHSSLNSVADPDPGIGLFRIPDPKPIFLRA